MKFVKLFEVLGEDIFVKDGNNGTLNVKFYGAKGDGANDDYQAFKNAYDECAEGGFIVIPQGTYNLSQNPNGNKKVTWIMDNGVTFVGAGAGSPSTGQGGFGSTVISNPWLVTSGNYGTYSLNGVACPPNGALNADSKELDGISGNGEHRWYNLEYRGTNTGDADNTNYNVELLNQVMNVTGCKGIVQEIDVNTYANPQGFTVGLFLTGGGNVQADCVAIDITRDSKQYQWVNGVSVKNAINGVVIDNTNVDNGVVFGTVNRKANPAIAAEQSANGNDGIVLRRKTDNAPTGNLIVAWNHDENDELFAVGASGDLRCKSLRVNGSPVASSLSRVNVTTDSQLWTVGEHTVNYTPTQGKTGLFAVEPTTLGFASNVRINSFSENSVTLYVETEGTGSLRFAVICQ